MLKQSFCHNRKKIFFLFVLFFSFNHCVILNIQDLPSVLPEKDHLIWSYHEKYVEIRGFWYLIPNENRGVLAAQSHLKSCCIQTQSSIYQQILINKKIEALDGQAIQLSGKFKIDPLYQSNGKLKHLYYLDDSHLIQRQTPFSFVLISLGGLILSIWCVYHFLVKKHS